MSTPAGTVLVRDGAFLYPPFEILAGTAWLLRHGRRSLILGPGDVADPDGVLAPRLARGTIIAATCMEIAPLSRDPGAGQT